MRIIISVGYIVQTAHSADEACELLTKFVKEKMMPIATEEQQNSLAIIIKESNLYEEFLTALLDFCEKYNIKMPFGMESLRPVVCNCIDCKIKRGEIIRMYETVFTLPVALTEKIRKCKELADKYNRIAAEQQALHEEIQLLDAEEKAECIALTPEQYKNAPYIGTSLSEDYTQVIAYTDFDAKTCEVITE